MCGQQIRLSRWPKCIICYKHFFLCLTSLNTIYKWLLNDAVMTQATSEQKVNTCIDQRQTMYH